MQFKGGAGAWYGTVAQYGIARRRQNSRPSSAAAPIFLDYEHQVNSWMRTARAETPALSSLLISHMRPAPRQVCLAEGSDILDHIDGVSKILIILRNYFAPEAVDAIQQQVMRFMRFRRADQSIEDYIMEFDLLRREAAPRMKIGAGFPERFVSLLRMDDAALSRHEKSSIMASCRKNLRFGSRGSGSRQDALHTEEAVEPHVSNEDLDVPAAYRKAKRKNHRVGKK